MCNICERRKVIVQARTQESMPSAGGKWYSPELMLHVYFRSITFYLLLGTFFFNYLINEMKYVLITK